MNPHSCESRENKRNREVYDFNHWYQLYRCPNSPLCPKRMLRQAYAIWYRDFRDDIDQESLESRIIIILSRCFETFDPTKGDQRTSVQDRFVKHFGYWFARKLRDARRDERPNRS